MNARTKKILKRVGIASLIVAFGAIVINNANAADPGAHATATTTYAPLPLPPRVVGNSQVNKNAVDWLQLGSQARAHIVSLENKAAAADAKATQALAKPEVLGKAGETKTWAPKVIENLGGKYFGDDLTTTADDRYTLIGTFTLPKGVWQVNTSVKFHRTAAGVQGSMPQVGLRIGQDQTLAGDAKWGTDAGTVGGNDISPASGHDLFGMAQATITLDATTTIVVDGFGYNWDQGTAGSGQIAAVVTVSPVRVG